MSAQPVAVPMPGPEEETHPLLRAIPLHEVWTTDDLDAIPEPARHFELLDGTLLVSPSPTDGHQTLVGHLMHVLDDVCPAAFHVTQGVEVRFSRDRSFIPDVLVVTRRAGTRGAKRFQPEEVALAVEVASQYSQSMDAILKPAVYAEAGIPTYWRIVTQPTITVHTHRLDKDSGLYISTGSFSDTVTTDDPWPMTFDVAQLKPRWQR